jgi:hypothetical protein
VQVEQRFVVAADGLIDGLHLVIISATAGSRNRPIGFELLQRLEAVNGERANVHGRVSSKRVSI